MVPYVRRVSDGHRKAQTPAGYLQAHRAAIGKLRAAGSRAEVHESPVVLAARVDGNEWLVQCECGAGNLVTPEWVPVFACCFGCGAIHRHVIVPDNWQEIEAILVRRIHPENRWWFTHETADMLRAENIRHGVDRIGG